jgi:hypothetical protein
MSLLKTVPRGKAEGDVEALHEMGWTDRDIYDRRNNRSLPRVDSLVA